MSAGGAGPGPCRKRERRLPSGGPAAFAEIDVGGARRASSPDAAVAIALACR